jgi:hypothetical protein
MWIKEFENLSFKERITTAYDLLNMSMFHPEFESRRAINDDGYEVHLIMMAIAKICELMAILNKEVNNE